jgi:hypothetical protein
MIGGTPQKVAPPATWMNGAVPWKSLNNPENSPHPDSYGGLSGRFAASPAAWQVRQRPNCSSTRF